MLLWFLELSNVTILHYDFYLNNHGISTEYRLNHIVHNIYATLLSDPCIRLFSLYLCYLGLGLGLLYSTSLSKICQLYRGGQFY